MACNSGESRTSREQAEMEHFTIGRGSKEKPCKKFFSVVGCTFGDECHFSHYVPGGGVNSFDKKRLLCYKYLSYSGCSDGCPYAHGERELHRPTLYMKIPDHMKPIHGCKFAKFMHPKSSFGAGQAKLIFSAERMYTKSLDLWLLNRMTRAKASIEDHESDPNMVNIHLEGTLDHVELASQIVREHVGSFKPIPRKRRGSRLLVLLDGG
ncbi:hypothetical protein POM88_014565 [Heracleum sosnowskyi]|uniref:C3H1-type domain-containing protein n=1 Tax=Heracleum sosnowskyi TaxID=360622 RepID=A0AAD8N3P7_9APIA|nr:hypothetical protein POM88_014565 [Heracleum sosnowskyi]